VAGPYTLFGGENLIVEIDGISQTVNFLISDFFTPGTALPSEVVVRLNKSLFGSTATLVNSGTKVKLTSNKWNGGTVLVTGGTAVPFLSFPSTQATSFISHVAAVESVNVQPYSFPAGNALVVVMDGNSANNFTVPVGKTGTSTAGTTAATIFDTTLNTTFPLAADLAGYEILFTSGAQSGNRRTISSYVPGTGQLVLALAFGGSPGVGSTYEILPTTTDQISRFWRNKAITLLSTQADIKPSSGGTKVQISSLSIGEDSSVLVAGGSANLILAFPVSTKIGVDAYRFYTGLAQITQWTVDGIPTNQDLYPGIRAAGVQVEVIEPVKVPIIVELDVTPADGVTLSSISNDIKSAVSSYINTLPVGADVIISQITCGVNDVTGVADVKVIQPSANVAVADNELGRIKDSDITVG
jgi:hypothetical protein